MGGWGCFGFCSGVLLSRMSDNQGNRDMDVTVSLRAARMPLADDLSAIHSLPILLSKPLQKPYTPTRPCTQLRSALPDRPFDTRIQ